MTDLTVAVVPREKFSYAPKTLDALLASRGIPFKIVYIDGGSPQRVADSLRSMLAGRPNTLLHRVDHYLGPMQSRNLAIELADTKYLVIVDNDIYVKPDCLVALLNCAEEEDAGAVVPLIARGAPDSSAIHVAGGECEVRHNEAGHTYLHHSQKWEHAIVDEVERDMVREPTRLLEDHCILARTDLWKSLGRLDEDICLMVSSTEISFLFQRTGAKLLFEPKARAAYLWGPEAPLELSDLPFWYLAWSEKWARAQLKALNLRRGIEQGFGNRTEMWWMGHQRRVPIFPLLQANERAFQRFGLPKLGHLVGKAIEITEVAASYLVAEWALRHQSGRALKCPHLFD